MDTKGFPFTSQSSPKRIRPDKIHASMWPQRAANDSECGRPSTRLRHESRKGSRGHETHEISNSHYRGSKKSRRYLCWQVEDNIQCRHYFTSLSHWKRKPETPFCSLKTTTSPDTRLSSPTLSTVLTWTPASNPGILKYIRAADDISSLSTFMKVTKFI